ncbi:HsdM family class I SAM-dependent methyltransferase [Arsukibacterium ikkense]|uniref:HsdM family class I SAM-dependent methyltransferase n=1 Tax=Arsukibacterium ikkense TaxID=336831 RepID=UPI001910A1E5|nr:N-6 DNA methylase [Arsukibacterium ikkense]
MVNLQLKLSIKRRIRALRLLQQKYGIDAATLIGTILRVWCNHSFSALPAPSMPYSPSIATEPKLLEFVILLNEIGFLNATYWLSSTYAILADDSYRKKMAMFFTPVSLTEGLLTDLADQGTDFGSQSFMDPACGGAAFLAPIALRMRAALLERGFTPREILGHIEEHLHGTDLDSTLCELSKHFLCMALYNEIQSTNFAPKFNVYQANSLSSLKSRLGKIDVVVCNPPFRKMTAEELSPLRSDYSEVIDAQPNLYCLFIALCTRLLREGGRAALVTPTSFLSGQYFSKLRKFLINNTTIEHIGMVSDRQGVFMDVEQETALTILRRRIEKNPAHSHANVSVVSATGKYSSVGDCVLPNHGLTWPIPRSIEDVTLVKKLSASKFRLADYGFKVRIGAYVWNRDKRPKFESLEEAKLANADSVAPLLWSRDISSRGVVKIEKNPTWNVEHRFVDIGLKNSSSVIKSPCVLLQRVTSNDQPRRLVAAIVSQDIFDTYGGFVGENHVVILEQVVEQPEFTPTNLVELLSTYTVDRYFRCISGATNVSVFELNQLALPDPAILREALLNGKDWDEAVVLAYQLI